MPKKLRGTCSLAKTSKGSVAGKRAGPSHHGFLSAGEGFAPYTPILGWGALSLVISQLSILSGDTEGPQTCLSPSWNPSCLQMAAIGVESWPAYQEVKVGGQELRLPSGIVPVSPDGPVQG